MIDIRYEIIRLNRSADRWYSIGRKLHKRKANILAVLAMKIGLIRSLHAFRLVMLLQEEDGQ